QAQGALMTNDHDDLSDTCMSAYNQWATTYDTMDNPVIAVAEEALGARAHLFRDAHILEVGSGTGRNASICLAGGARDYIGIERASAMLDVATSKVTDPRVSFIEADLLAGMARVRARPIDVILICLVLEHFSNVDVVLEAAGSLLRSGGRLLLFELHPDLY